MFVAFPLFRKLHSLYFRSDLFYDVYRAGNIKKLHTYSCVYIENEGEIPDIKFLARSSQERGGGIFAMIDVACLCIDKTAHVTFKPRWRKMPRKSGWFARPKESIYYCDVLELFGSFKKGAEFERYLWHWMIAFFLLPVTRTNSKSVARRDRRVSNLFYYPGFEPFDEPC